jgi:putative transposase
VEAFRTRPLDAGPYTFVAADALVLKVREAGRRRCQIFCVSSGHLV